jgi:uncharacterized protein (DUF608 family)
MIMKSPHPLLGLVVMVVLLESFQTLSAQPRKYNDVYQGSYLNQVAFPIGGIGAGMFCIEGTGAISHMSVGNTPNVFNEPCMFAAISVKGLAHGVKVLEGQVPDRKKFGQPHAGGGAGGTSWGFPRFDEVEFLARFPFCELNLKEKGFPLEVHITGWSPFIPTDADNSSLPVGGLEYSFTNIGLAPVEAVFSYNSVNFMAKSNGIGSIIATSNGFVLSFKADSTAPQETGDFAIFTDNSQTVVDHCWFRGGWFDPLSLAWQTIKKGELKNNPPVKEGAPGASLFVPLKLNPGETTTVSVRMAWYVPTTDQRFGNDTKDPKDITIDTTTCSIFRFYHPWYSSKFADIDEVVAYWNARYDDLRSKSILFKNAFYNSTLPAEVLEAVAANLTILKSPTVLWQYDGRLWNWEGCGDSRGCCHGSCTHVWNYAQAIPHLFPSLERTLRNTEFGESQNAQGHQVFRAALPIRPQKHTFYAASDGQLGGIMKVYRDWRISGDNEWLKNIYPKVRASMDYCINTWDPRHRGVVEEPHHNTYDIEFWGPDGMITGFYLGALNAMCNMGEFLKEDITTYRDLYLRGKQLAETSLYDGEYFFQKTQWLGLSAPDPVEAARNSPADYTDEVFALLQKEGPKYQYGTGCLSDGVLGCWISRVCGLEEPYDAQKIKSHLLAVYKYNFRKDLSDHENPQRPGYALGHEGGLLLCTWPKGGEPSLPFVYSNEVWTGIEYQVASHLMFMGEVGKGLDIVRACRDRYDGRVRNPFDEYECGHWYARAMSSYGLLEGLTGMRYDAVTQTLYIDSKVGDFTSFLSTATGFGNVELKNGIPSLKVVYGKIDVKKAMVSGREVKR